MKLLKHILFAAALVSASGIASAAPASDASIRQLLEVTQARKVIDGVQLQYGNLVDAVVKQALRGNAPNAKQQQAADKLKVRLLSLVKDTVSWQKMEPSYLQFYSETFTEEEVTGMLAFYKTPAGQAVIHKMPVLMQKNTALIQQLTVSMQPQMEQIQRDFIADLKAAN
ncbi:DUF2059 domain-containing protein [Herbaspirillum sp. NPDC087042]|uniref:DUF2059 domain-containing protein n=1 Tax=Herbaspirillum sp. NPDC087042 TaxID=3364004 RepID=UPI003814DD88